MKKKLNIAHSTQHLRSSSRKSGRDNMGIAQDLAPDRCRGHERSVRDDLLRVVVELFVGAAGPGGPTSPSHMVVGVGRRLAHAQFDQGF